MPPKAHEDGGAFEVKLALDAFIDDSIAAPAMDTKPAGKNVRPKQKSKSRKERKGFQWCPGCDEQKPADSFALNQRFDMECKRLLDRIYNQCKTQGETEWFNQQRSQDDCVKKVLDHYRSLQAKVGENSGSKAKFSAASYKEAVTTEQGTEFRGKGTMMWEGQAIEFWMSMAGGGLSNMEAVSRWQDWFSHYKERKIIHDFNSPNESKPLRLRIPTGDDVDFVNANKKSKTAEQISAPIKKPKAEDIDKLVGQCYVGFNSIGNGSANGDMLEVAQNMVSAGAGSAFDGVSMRLADVTSLGGKSNKKGEGEESDADDDDQDPGSPDGKRSKRKADDEAEAPPSAKKAKWVDLGQAINSAKRTLRAAYVGIEAKYKDVISKASAAKDGVVALPPLEQKQFMGEMKILETRLEGCTLVSGTSPPELASYILRFNAKPAAEAATGSGAAPNADTPPPPPPPHEGGNAETNSTLTALKKLGEMPPCNLYKDLLVLSTLDEIVDKIDTCTTKDDITAVTNEFNTQKVPIMDLHSTTTAAIGELAKARKTYDAAKSGKADAKKAPAPVVIRSVLFDEGVQHAQQIRILDETNPEAIAALKDDLSTPVNFKLKPDVQKTFRGQSEITGFLKSFSAMVTHSEKYIYESTDGRTMAKAPEKSAMVIKARAKAIFPQALCEASVLKGPNKDIVKDNLEVTFFALLPGVDSGGIEKEFIPCLRLAISGQRQIIMTPFHEMMAYMASKRVPFTDFSIKQVRDYFMGMTSDSLEDYKKSYGLHHLTLEVDTMLYIPAGYIYCERGSRDGESVFGVKISVANASKGNILAFEKLQVAKDKYKKDVKIISAFLAEFKAER